MFLQFIIPYYGSADLLITAANSIFNQTDTNDIGLIVVDDNDDETNNFPETLKVVNFLCDKVADTSNPVKITYIKNPRNLGVGPTRNKGLKAATADYITFVDSDDEIDKEFVSFFREKLIKHKCNIFVGKYFYTVGDQDIVSNHITWLHGKVYKLSFLRYNHIFFPPLRFNEDSGFNTMTFEMTKNIYYYPENKILYYWKQDNKNSLTKQAFTDLYSVEYYVKSLTFAMRKVLKKYQLNNTSKIPSTILQMYRYYCELLYKDIEITSIIKENLQEFFNVISNTKWYESERCRKELGLGYFSSDINTAIVPEITLSQFVSLFEKEKLNFR